MKRLITLLKSIGELAKTSHYEGPLTPEQAFSAIKRAAENATDLIFEAKLLRDNKRYSRSIALAILAIEEITKSKILERIAYENNIRKINSLWREYRSHKAKLIGWMFPLCVNPDLKTTSRLSMKPKSFGSYEEIIQNGDYANYINSIKQKCFYTYIDENIEASSPQLFNEEVLANFFIKLAENHSPTIESADEIKIYLKHVINGEITKVNIVGYLKDMILSGHISKPTAEIVLSIIFKDTTLQDMIEICEKYEKQTNV